METGNGIPSTKIPETRMLALLGFITIVLLFTAILTKKMSPLVALIAIPIAAALIGGFGMQTSKFIVSGVTSIAPVAGMFVFAILFFGIVTDAGMLDPIITRILRTDRHAAEPHRAGHCAARAAGASGWLGRSDFSGDDPGDAAAVRAPRHGSNAFSLAPHRWRPGSISCRGPGRWCALRLL
jgi:hypothetical protein